MLATAGNFLFRYRNSLFPLACVLLFLPGPDPFPDPLDAAAVGALIAALGQIVRAATIGLRYVIRGGRGRRVYAEDLVTEGIYSHSRNPMYVGNLLIMIGVALASNSWATIAVAVPLGFFMYASIVAAEEDYLQGRFGSAFTAYCHDVPRWLPRLSGLGRTLSSMQFHWRRVIVKEYGTPFGWISVIVLIALYNVWMAGQWQTRLDEVHGLEIVLVVVTMAWMVAFSLKRARRLVAD
ncbi:MAG TPA: isoprenylcysteine carboxylmethyltransferase family protein [Steroidobacteraceae bacterium]|nr:isoprenylcysteine carboxylmethyltransferase family protein [Steroidobacteraceae bacterium]